MVQRRTVNGSAIAPTDKEPSDDLSEIRFPLVPLAYGGGAAQYNKRKFRIVRLGTSAKPFRIVRQQLPRAERPGHRLVSKNSCCNSTQDIDKSSLYPQPVRRIPATTKVFHRCGTND